MQSTLLKHNRVAPQEEEIKPFLLDQINLVAAAKKVARAPSPAEIIRDAECKAIEIKDEAEKTGRQEGFEKGLEEGLQAGRQQAVRKFAQETSTASGAIETLLAAMEQSKREFVARCQRDLVQLAIAIAERIVKKTGLLDPTVVVENLTEAVALTAESSDLTIHLNPQDASHLRECHPDLVGRLQSARHADLIEDEAVSPGGCLVAAKGGEIDARLETQIEQIATELLPDSETLR